MKRHLVEDEIFDHGSTHVQNKRLCAANDPFARLSDELILLVLSGLNAQEVCTTKLLNRRFANLATDQMLWQHLYRAQYLRPMHDGALGQLPRARRSKRSLGLLTEDDRVKRVGGIDWQKRYRIRSNWSRGRCKTTTTNVPCTQNRTLDGHEFSLSGMDLAIDNSRSGISDCSNLDNIFLPSSSTILVVGAQYLSLYDCQLQKMLHVLPIATPHSCKYHESFLALMRQDNTLSVYHIDNKIHHTLTLKGPLDQDVQTNLRQTQDNLVVELVYVECGILDSVIKLQEIVISKSTLSILRTRIATSPSFPSSRSVLTKLREKSVEKPHTMVYHHPYLLVPIANHICLHTVHSSPDKLVISRPQLLWGYGSSITSCQIQRALRFVVGSGDAGLKLWDLHCEDPGNIILHNVENSSAKQQYPQSYQQLFDSPPVRKDTTGIISTVSESLIISTFNNGTVTTHDFTI